MSVEGLHDLGEVKQRARQAVDLINDNHVHLAVRNIGEKPLQGRALQSTARKAAVVV